MITFGVILRMIFINYFEQKGSAQCKSSVMLAALNSPGTTIIKAKKSRDHTEKFFKYLKLPINIIRNKNFDTIKAKHPETWYKYYTEYIVYIICMYYVNVFGIF